MSQTPDKKDRIRVLLIAPSMGMLGGQAVQASRLLSCLNELPSLEVAFQPIDPQLPSPMRFLQSIKYVRTMTAFVAYCAILLTRVPECDVLHVFSASNYSYMLWTLPALACARLYRKKIIANYRDGRAEDHLRKWCTAVPTIRAMDAIVTPSRFVADVFTTFGLHAQSIPNIIDTSQFHFRERARPRPVFLHNRILEPLYNVECTLRAFGIVQSRYPEARLTVTHDGICRPGLEKLCQELRLRNVQFVGRIPHPRMRELYDASDIYLTSPNFDCMPGSLLECFASGLPVIATRAGGIPYIVDDGRTGLLVNPNDPEAMAACAFRLIEEDGLGVALARNAREECGKYDYDLVRAEWQKLYCALMDPKSCVEATVRC
jgi:glycosyltransferase involved in cell wall biosynthesis